MLFVKGRAEVIVNKKQIAKRFNRAAKTYDEFALVQRRMAHRIISTLKEKFPHADRILEIGAGTGYFTQLLANSYPKSRITAIDYAEKMIEYARKKVIAPNPVDFILADAERIKDLFDQESFDLVVSNATFHWFASPEQILCQCRQLLKPGGLLLFSTFGPDTFLELRSQFERVEMEMGLEPANHGLALRSSMEWHHLVYQSSFQEIQVDESWMRCHYHDCRDFLQSIKATGGSYSEADYNLITLKNVLTKVMEKYNLAYRSKAGVYATYHVLQIMGQKGGQLCYYVNR
jgi:malonyl-CoA O-methyltransferase